MNDKPFPATPEEFATAAKIEAALAPLDAEGKRNVLRKLREREKQGYDDGFRACRTRIVSR